MRSLMSLTLLQSDQAEHLLRSESFRSQWTELYRACPWATPSQTWEFVTSWFELYKTRYQLLLVCESTPEGVLIGLLPLGWEYGSKRATLPGAHQAEYKSWLALPCNA